MPGTLTIGGMSYGLASGGKVIGPVTTTGNNQIGGLWTGTLSTGTTTIAVPVGARAVAIFLGTSVSSSVKVRTNLNADDDGLPISPTASIPWTKFDLPTGATEIILRVAEGTVANVNVTFI